jgi:hypothetical protein
MKRLLTVVAAFALSGCVAHMSPYGISIEPMLDFVLVGPPIVVAPPPQVAVQPLPPVVVVPDRSVYSYNNLFYYFWADSWYWGRERGGPWHPLDRQYWPPRTELREPGRGNPPPGGGPGHR